MLDRQEPERKLPERLEGKWQGGKAGRGTTRMCPAASVPSSGVCRLLSRVVASVSVAGSALLSPTQRALCPTPVSGRVEGLHRTTPLFANAPFPGRFKRFGGGFGYDLRRRRWIGRCTHTGQLLRGPLWPSGGLVSQALSGSLVHHAPGRNSLAHLGILTFILGQVGTGPRRCVSALAVVRSGATSDEASGVPSHPHPTIRDTSGHGRTRAGTLRHQRNMLLTRVFS